MFLKPRFWGFWNILGYFKIDELLLKFWDGFCLHDLKTSCIASHMYYNYIFMHLDVCYICSIDYVFVGLDWAKPMMKFFLHVTCSCISHAYILCFSIYLLYLNYFGAFLIVFFSPLSILFTLVVSMAPKRKSIPARNPLHFGTSLSFDSAPLFMRFRDDDAHKAFTKNFFRRGIHFEHQVILAVFADIDLPIERLNF